MNRFGQIKKWMNENRSHPVITITKEAPDDELSESGRCLKYAYELLDMIESPNDKDERLAVNGVSPETETPNPEQTVKLQPDSQFAPSPLLGDMDVRSTLREEIVSLANETLEFLRSSKGSCYPLIEFADRLYRQSHS